KNMSLPALSFRLSAFGSQLRLSASALGFRLSALSALRTSHCALRDYISANVPVLSPNDGMSVSPRPWSAVSMALAIGVPSGALTCQLPLSIPLALPAKNSGQRLWL